MRAYICLLNANVHQTGVSKLAVQATPGMPEVKIVKVCDILYDSLIASDIILP
jgi:hypothetical protein